MGNEGTWMDYILNINFFTILIGCEIAFLIADKKVETWIKNHSLLIWLWIIADILTWIITGIYIEWIKYTIPMQLFGYIIPYALTILWVIVIDIRLDKLNLKWLDIERIKRYLTYLNNASYSIFLTHFIALQVLMMDFGIRGKLWLLYKGSTPFILIGVGCLGYQFIEKKMRGLMK